MRKSSLRHVTAAALAAGGVTLFEVLRTIAGGATTLGGVAPTAAFAFAVAGLLGLPLFLAGLIGASAFAGAAAGWRWGVGPVPPARRVAWLLFAGLIAVALVFGVQAATIRFVRAFRQPVYQGLGAGLVALGIVAAGAALAGGAVGLFERLVGAVSRRLPAPLDFTTARGAALWVATLALVGAGLAPVLVSALHTVDLRPARLILAWIAGLVAAHWLYLRWPRRLSLQLGGGALIVAFVAGFAWSAAALGQNQARMVAVDRDTLLAGFAARRLGKLGDADGDGQPRFFAGGDCDDHDANVRPGVYDAPGDGVDQNCTGADLDLAQDPLAAPTRPPIGHEPRPWHVILLTVDALRGDVVQKEMPHLQALAAESLDYRNAYSHGAATYWSLPALLESTVPSRLHMGRDQTPVPQSKLLPEVFQEAGWHTALFANVTVFFVRGLRQGAMVADYETSDFTVHGAKPGSAHLTDRVIAHVDRWKAGALPSKQDRLFVWAHYYDPHDPYFEVPDYPAASDADRDRYDAIVRYTDAQIGRLVAHLKAAGLWAETVLIVTADHGDEFLDHGHRFHGTTLYEEMVHVPLIMHVPGLVPRVIEGPIGHMEVAPTLLDLVGVEIPRTFRGRSRAAEARSGVAADDAPVFFEVFPDSNYAGHQVGVRLGRHKLIYRLTENYFELYDLADDPAERVNLFDTSAAAGPLRERLMVYLDHHLYWLGQGLTGGEVPPGSPPPKPPRPAPRKGKRG